MMGNLQDHLMGVRVDKDDANEPVGIITPMDFTRYRDSIKGDKDSNTISRILEYYRDAF